MPPNAQIVKACSAMKKLGYSVKVVRPVLQKLLKLYEKNWVLIEEDNYQVLVDAILDSEEQKARHDELQDLNTWSKDEAGNEPPQKKSKLGSQERQSSTSLYALTLTSSNDVKDQPHGKQKLAESIYENLQDKDIELKAPCVVQLAKETNFVSDIESDKCNPMVALACLEHSKDKSYIQYGFSEKRTTTYERGNCTLFSKKTGSTPPAPSKDVCSIGKKSDLKVNNSEHMDCAQPGAEKNENKAQGPLKLDVASSSGGEVKIFLMAQFSPKSDFHVPRLEAVIQQVEEHCLKSHKIPQTGFSLMTLMKEVCECFLDAGNTSTYSEDVRPIDVSSLDKDTDLETGSAEGIDCQLRLCSTISNNPFRIQNLFEVSPQIPRFIGSIELDLSHCTIYLNVDLKRFGGMERNIMEVNNHAPSSSRLMIVQKCYYHYITDITKGQEASEISLINEVNEEPGPAFNYIPRNMAYRDAYARFLLAYISDENCCSFGDCLSLEIPCACVGKTGYEFAYTTGSLLKESFLDNIISKNYSALQHNLFYCQDCPIERCKGNIFSCKCKGHTVRNFIRECWCKCGCSISCGNRVVQRGITAKLQVFRTPRQKGWGLRTLEDVPKGAFICEYVGEVITSRESFERNLQNTGEKLTYPVLLDADWTSKGVLKDEQALCLDTTVYGNVARFINHRCFDANLMEIPVEVETADHSYYHLAFFTTRKVDAFEELTWDYGIDFYHPVKAFQCLCGSKFCRDIKSLKRKLECWRLNSLKD